mgnify:CR=1 FL=1
MMRREMVGIIRDEKGDGGNHLVENVECRTVSSGVSDNRLPSSSRGECLK